MCDDWQKAQQQVKADTVDKQWLAESNLHAAQQDAMCCQQEVHKPMKPVASLQRKLQGVSLAKHPCPIRAEHDRLGVQEQVGRAIGGRKGGMLGWGKGHSV